MERATYTESELLAIAKAHDLGTVHFEKRTALNTGKLFMAAYVYAPTRTLFAKATRSIEGYYLCNEFAKLEESK